MLGDKELKVRDLPPQKYVNTEIRPVMAVLKSTGLVGLIGSDPESGRQVHGNGCEGFGEAIDQHPEEDAKCLQFTRLRIQGLYQNKL